MKQENFINKLPVGFKSWQDFLSLEFSTNRKFGIYYYQDNDELKIQYYYKEIIEKKSQEEKFNNKINELLGE